MVVVHIRSDSNCGNVDMYIGYFSFNTGREGYLSYSYFASLALTYLESGIKIHATVRF